MTLSVCLITKNEEAHLARCLESVRGLWDDLVVVDTGSTDRTIEIAREFGARVLHFTWQDDFSLARNFCIGHATGDWILSLDADETIAARDHASIRAQIARDDLDAVFAVQRHYLAGTVIGWQPGSGGYDEGKPYPGYLDTPCRRLFRNRPWLRFQNPVHEILVSTDPAKAIADITGGWVIHHFGKLGDEAVLRAKAEHYLSILRRKVQQQPDNPQAYHELAVQLSELRRFDAALEAFEQVMRLSPNYSDTPLQIAICHIGLQQPRQAFAALREAAAALPHLAGEIALAEGNLHRDEGDAAAAERAYRRGLDRNPAFAAVSQNLALLYERDDRREEAFACVTAALAHTPDHPALTRLRSRLARAVARALAQQRRFAEAREYLGKAGDADDAELDALRGAVALGLGDPAGAAEHLRRSLQAAPTCEAALNLAVACEACGDTGGALAASATALGVAPEDGAALARFTRLAGNTRRRPEKPAGQRLTIFFYLPRGLAFDGATPRARGIGGTESALVYLAEALARRGHRVAVFNGCEAPGVVEGVEYARWETLPARCVADGADVVVAVRDWRLIGRARLAPLQLFWSLDACDQRPLANLRDRGGRGEIDFLVLGSDWQAETFAATHDVPAWQMLQPGNGTAASACGMAAPAPSAPRRRALAYASTPFRGLDVLLDVFPRIRAACPDAELDVFSSMRVYGIDAAEDQQQFGTLYEKAKQPGVHLVGTVPQPELAARLQQARVLAYPNHYAETFCIAAIEAQAAGCPVVTTALGALPQTVGDGGICIAGDARSAAYQDRFVTACVELLTDDERWQALSAAAIARTARDYTWPVVAARWEALCRAALAPSAPVIERVATHLAAGRAALAHRMLQREAAPAGATAWAWAALERFVASRAGAQEPLAADDLRTIALHFPAVRRAGLLETAASVAAGSAA